jgi:hypothetical protein
MIGMSGAIGENERQRTRALEPVMNTKLVARVPDNKCRTFLGPLVGGFFSELNLMASSVEGSTGIDWPAARLLASNSGVCQPGIMAEQAC